MAENYHAIHRKYICLLVKKMHWDVSMKTSSVSFLFDTSLSSDYVIVNYAKFQYPAKIGFRNMGFDVYCRVFARASAHSLGDVRNIQKQSRCRRWRGHGYNITRLILLLLIHIYIYIYIYIPDMSPLSIMYSIHTQICIDIYVYA